MEPFKIQVEVKLSDETLEAIKRIALAAIFTKLTPEAQEEIERNTFKDEEPQHKAGDPQINEEPAPASAEEPAPAAEGPDMPEDVYGAKPEQAREISDDEVAAKTREAVAALKKQKRSSTIIRTEIFAKYGISQSVACPQEHRAELLADLDNLIAAE